MDEPIVRLQEIKLISFKNTLQGTVAMPSVKKQLYFDYAADILGIYGQNGTGKTSIIEALSLIKVLISGKAINKDYSKYIAFGHDSCTICATFLIDILSNKFKAEYEITLQRAPDTKPDSDEENDENKELIISESLKYAIWNNEEKTFSIKSLLFKYENTQPKNFSPKNLYKAYIDASKENQLNIPISLAVAQNNRSSILFNPSLLDIISETEAIKPEREYAKIQHLSLITQSLYKFIKCDVFIILNDQLSEVQGHRGVPIHLRQNLGHQIIVGGIFIKLGDPYPIKAKEFQIASTVIKNINKVLDSIIPDLQIELKNLGKEIDQDGNESIRAQFLSIKNEVTIPLQYESSGIIKIISILTALIHVFHSPSACLIADELDAGVFEYLLGELLKIFNDKAKGQIIFTSHNLRALELLPKESLIFSTTNPDNRYIKMRHVKKNNNMRDQYYRAILLGGQDEELYKEISTSATAKAFRSIILGKEED